MTNTAENQEVHDEHLELRLVQETGGKGNEYYSLKYSLDNKLEDVADVWASRGIFGYNIKELVFEQGQQPLNVGFSFTKKRANRLAYEHALDLLNKSGETNRLTPYDATERDRNEMEKKVQNSYLGIRERILDSPLVKDKIHRAGLFIGTLAFFAIATPAAFVGDATRKITSRLKKVTKSE